MTLGEGDFLALSDALRRQLIDLAALVQPTAKDGLRLAGVAAMAWEAGGHGIALQGDAAWRKRLAPDLLYPEKAERAALIGLPGFYRRAPFCTAILFDCCG